ncbi:MAG TPA: glutamate racemase [Microthrixaceae bacterium]|nr:glutamate racemase [Microthrixaceae bacterium]RTL06955.1 MAG: glutamate racemase [Acidimicrobiia bacterium]MCB9375716.1 glutamate racemase [Microthrixaceae bacterium]MCB9400536.1 glutamate racemase [Microthrixaceae bacterium]MCO5304684.1 glutamate racemase [Microthrixaceae bacterium]
MRDGPIGMFDSGFGGLTVARAVIDLLPAEDLVYLGDTGRYPYGPRPLDEVARFAHQIARELVERRGVKLLVVACNTASAAALDSLRDRFEVPVIGVIEPGVTALVQATVTGRVGVVGTVGTINSGAYQRAVAAASDDAELIALACPGFVEFVERGEFDSEQVHVLARALLEPAREAKVDTLLLGCTHYPYLARTLNDVMGRDVVLVSSADETAFEVRRVLSDLGLARPATGADASGRASCGRAEFITTGDVNWFEELGRRLLGPELDRAEKLSW